MKNTTKVSKSEKLLEDKLLKDIEYPATEDIYNQFKKESEIDPEDTSKKKEVIKIDKNPTWNEKNLTQDKSGSDLDVPGSELDDDQETNGSEDEENNFYSIGGDNHNDLEEDNQ